MAIVLNGTTGITNDGGYTGDGVVFADTTPANTLVTTTGGHVGIGVTNTFGFKLHITSGASTSGQLISSSTTGVYTNWSDGGATNSPAIGGIGNNLVFNTSGTERARFDSGGSFLFPNSTGTRPGSSGQYIVASTAFYQQSGGNYYLVTTAGGSTSDATLKTNVQQLSGALEKVCAIRGVSFEFIEEPMCTADKGTQLGVIAQEVEAQYPEIVLTDENGIKTVRYDRLVAPLIEAVKEQQAIITAQAAQIQQLREKVLEVEEGTSNMLVENTNNLYETITALTARVAALEGTQP